MDPTKAKINVEDSQRSHSDDYDEDFEENQEEEDKMVDEEIVQSDLKDSDYLNELMGPSKHFKKSTPKQDLKKDSMEGSSDSDEIDDFIKKHMEEKEEPQPVIPAPTETTTSTKDDEDTYSSEEETEEDVLKLKEKKLTPKQSLVEELIKLGDKLGKYSLTDRYQSLSDLLEKCSSQTLTAF
jgi:hypothetical protein